MIAVGRRRGTIKPVADSRPRPRRDEPMPPLNRPVIRIEDCGDVSVVRFVDTKLIDEEIINAIGAELGSLVEDKGRRNLRLDFTGMDYVASAALGKFLSLHRKVKAAGGRLVLCNLDPAIREVLAISRLDHFFEIE